MFYPDCTYADMNSNKCKEGFIVLWTGLKNKQKKKPNTQTVKVLRNFVSIL